MSEIKGEMGFWGKLTPKCPKCGRYMPYHSCDLCDPPKVSQEPHLDLLGAMAYVKATTNIDIKELVWAWLIRQWFWCGNDKCFRYWFEIDKYDDVDDKEMKAYMFMIKKAFKLGEMVYFNVCW